MFGRNNNNNNKFENRNSAFNMANSINSSNIFAIPQAAPFKSSANRFGFGQIEKPATFLQTTTFFCSSSSSSSRSSNLGNVLKPNLTENCNLFGNMTKARFAEKVDANQNENLFSQLLPENVHDQNTSLQKSPKQASDDKSLIEVKIDPNLSTDSIAEQFSTQLKKIKQQHQNEIESKDLQIQETQKRLLDAQNKFEKLTNEYEEEFEFNMSLEMECVKGQFEIETIGESVKKLDEQLEENASAMDILTQTINQAESAKEIIQNDIKLANKKYGKCFEAQTERYDEKFNEEAKKVQNKWEQIEEWTAKCEKQQKQNEQISNELAGEESKIEQQCSELREQIAANESTNDELREKQQSTEEALSQIGKKLAEAKEENERQIAQLAAELCTVEQDGETIWAEMSAKQAQHYKMIEKLNADAEVIGMLEKAIEELQNREKEMQDKIRNLSDDIDAATTRNLEFRSTETERNSRLIAQSAERVESCKAVASKREKFNEIFGEVFTLAQMNRWLSENISDYANRRRVAERKREELLDEMQQKNAKIDQMEAKLRESDQIAEILSRRIGEFDRENSLLASDLAGQYFAQRKLSRTMQELSGERNRMKEEIAKLGAELCAITADREATERDRTIIDERLRAMRKNEQTMAAFERTMREMIAVHEQFAEVIKAKDAKIDQLRHVNEAYGRDIEAAKSEKDRLYQSYQRLIVGAKQALESSATDSTGAPITAKINDNDNDKIKGSEKIVCKNSPIKSSSIVEDDYKISSASSAEEHVPPAPAAAAAAPVVMKQIGPIKPESILLTRKRKLSTKSGANGSIALDRYKMVRFDENAMPRRHAIGGEHTNCLDSLPSIVEDDEEVEDSDNDRNDTSDASIDMSFMRKNYETSIAEQPFSLAPKRAASNTRKVVASTTTTTKKVTIKEKKPPNEPRKRGAAAKKQSPQSKRNTDDDDDQSWFDDIFG